MRRYGGESGEDKKKEKKPAKRSWAWMLAGMPLLVVIYKGLVLVGGKDGGGTALMVTAALAAIYLLAMIVGAVVFPGRIQWRGDLLLLAAYVFFGLAALTKELAAVLPLLLIAVEIVLLRVAGKRGQLRRALIYHAPFLATLVLFFVLRTLVVLSVGQAVLSEGTELSESYLMQQVSGSVIMDYMGKIFVPLQLNIDPDVRLFNPAVGDRLLSTGFAALFLVIIATILLLRRAPLVAFGLVWFFIALLPTSSVLKFADVMAEHRVYLASLGIFAAVGVAVTEAVRTRKRTAVRIVLGAMALLLFAAIVGGDIIKVCSRNRQYRDPAVLWADTIGKSPLKARPYVAMGYIFMKKASPERLSYSMNRIKQMEERLAELKGLPNDDPAVQFQASRLMRSIDRLAAQLESQRASLAVAMMFLGTCERYDQRDVAYLQDAPAAAVSMYFAHREGSRLMNNIGVVHSQAAEGYRMEARYADELRLDESVSAKKALTNQLQALRYYRLSLMINPLGLEALLNSSKIRLSMAYDYEDKALANSRDSRRLWRYTEEELLESENLVLRAMAVNPRHMGAINHLRTLEMRLAVFYDPDADYYRLSTKSGKISIETASSAHSDNTYTFAGPKWSKDAAEALKHWKTLEKLGAVDPIVDVQAARDAIDRLENRLGRASGSGFGAPYRP
jgi:predicted transcriptional regulator